MVARGAAGREKKMALLFVVAGTAAVLCGDGASWWWREDGRTRALMDA